MGVYDWANMTPLGRQIAIAAGANPDDGYMPAAGAGAAPGYYDNNYGPLTTGGQYSFARNNLTKWNPQKVYSGNAETGIDEYADPHPWSRFVGADGKPLAAFKGYKDHDGYVVFPDPGDFGGTGFSGQKLGKMAGVKYDKYDANGNYVGSDTFKAADGWKDENVGDALGVGSIIAMAAGAAAAGLGSAAGAGAGTTAGTAAGGFAGDATAAGYAGLDAASAGSLGGGASGAWGGGLGASELGTMGAGSAGLGSSVFNPAVDSQLASTQLGITGDMAAADAAAAGIPSVTVNGAPTGSWLSNLSASGGAVPGVGDVGGGVAGQVASALTGGNGAAGGLGSLLPGGWGSLLLPALQLLGGAYTAHQADKAADTMADAANSGIAENRRQFDLVRGLLQPYVDAGTGALGSYQSLSGAKGAGAQQTEISALQGTPQFTSLVQQGEDAILQNASATGGLRGGNVQGGLANFRTNVLSGLIDKQLGRYGTLMQLGQASAAGTGAAALQTGNSNAALMQQQGAAQAGGITAGTSAIVNAVGGAGGYLTGQAAVMPQVSQFGGAVIAPGQARI